MLRKGIEYRTHAHETGQEQLPLLTPLPLLQLRYREGANLSKHQCPSASSGVNPSMMKFHATSVGEPFSCADLLFAGSQWMSNPKCSSDYCQRQGVMCRPCCHHIMKLTHNSLTIPGVCLLIRQTISMSQRAKAIRSRKTLNDGSPPEWTDKSNVDLELEPPQSEHPKFTKPTPNPKTQDPDTIQLKRRP